MKLSIVSFHLPIPSFKKNLIDCHFINSSHKRTVSSAYLTFFLTAKGAVLSLGHCSPRGHSTECPKTFLIITTEGKGDRPFSSTKTKDQ